MKNLIDDNLDWKFEIWGNVNYLHTYEKRGIICRGSVFVKVKIVSKWL